MAGYPKAVPGSQSFLEALYFRVHGLYERTAGSADKVVVVGAGAGWLVAGHAVGGDELGGLAAAAEEFESPVDRGYPYARQPLPGGKVYLFRAQMPRARDQHLEYGVTPAAVACAPAVTAFPFLERFLRHIDNDYHYPIIVKTCQEKCSASQARQSLSGLKIYIIA